VVRKRTIQRSASQEFPSQGSKLPYTTVSHATKTGKPRRFGMIPHCAAVSRSGLDGRGGRAVLARGPPQAEVLGVWVSIPTIDFRRIEVVGVEL